MDSIENKLQKLLEGNSVNDNDDLCDFTLLEQNEAAGTCLLLLLFVITLNYIKFNNFFFKFN